MKFEIWKSKKSWFWHLVTRNGRIVADSAEGYRTKKACLRGIELVKSAVEAEIVEVEA